MKQQPFLWQLAPWTRTQRDFAFRGAGAGALEGDGGAACVVGGTGNGWSLPWQLICI